jgi:hypothetical protein
LQQNRPTKNERALSIELKMEVAPTLRQDTTISLYLVSSDMVIVVNPIPLVSALQTLLEASSIPFQYLEEEKTEEMAEPLTGRDTVASHSPAKMVLSGNDSDDEEDVPEAGPLDALTTDIDIKVEQVSIIFLVNGTSTCQDILHFDVKDIGITLDSKGMSGMLTLATEPFEMRPGQVINAQPFDWSLLPFKPVASIQGVRLIASTKETRFKTESILEVDIKQGLESVLVSASSLTLAALNGAIESLQPFIASDEEYEKQLEAQKQAKLDDFRSNVQRQRRELINLFNAIDVDQSHTLQDNELGQLIRMMIEKTGSGLPTINSATGLTSAEFDREKDFLLSILDSKGVNEVTLPELEMILYQIGSKIDDCNLRAEAGTTGVSFLDNVAKSKYFLSGPTLRQLIQFEDLKEYTAMHHVFRITGHDDIEKKSSFPPLSTWLEGGIELFWNHYASETGCSRNSLNGQDIKMVQQKLVRSLW